jgi:farnesyl-diphosphate farnesyltransferase
MIKSAAALRGDTEEHTEKHRRTSAATGGDALDTEFCRDILPRVSRTFALSIEALPDGLRTAVGNAYLLCRIVDSIEDEPSLDGGHRNQLFETFDRLLDDATDAAAFELMCARASVGGAGAHGELCRRSGAVFRRFAALPASQRSAIRPHVLEMSAGMRSYCARGVGPRPARPAPSQGFHISHMADLERYCYFVAGTVGNLLTALFEDTVDGLSEEARRGLRERAVPFGIGLQMVNVVKDVAADAAERGVCFLPLDLADQHGLAIDRLLEPGMRDAGVAVVRAVCARAREHLRHAEEYVALWPTSGPGEQAARAVRLFCVVPLALALATLQTVEQGSGTLQPGTEPKVGRTAVGRILVEAVGAAASNDALVALLDRCRSFTPAQDQRR